MSTAPQTTDGDSVDSARERAEHHAAEAERMHATLAVYYAGQAQRP